MTYLEIGRRLKLVRIHLELTQDECGAFIHCDQSKFCKIEHGKPIGLIDMHLLATALHFSVDALLADRFDLLACFGK